MKRLIYLIPLLLLLSGCMPTEDLKRLSDLENEVSITNGNIDKIEDEIAELRGGQKILDEKINLVDSQVASNFGIKQDCDNLETEISPAYCVDIWKDIPTKEKDNDICVGIRDITVATYQAKDLFECIGEGNGTCTCIEQYASCSIDLSDIPKEARYDFNPDCGNQ